MLDYHFPRESELFVHQPYTSRFEANAALRRSLATNIAGFAQGALVFTVSFVLIFSLGFGMAAVFDQGRENWTNTRIANVTP